MMSAELKTFYSGKRVFITSPTSFLGSWLSLSLQHLGASVIGFGEENFETSFFQIANIAQNMSMTYGDLRDEKALRQVLQYAQADVVIHVGEGGRLHEQERNSVELFAKSVVGTAQLLELLRETASVRSVVVASSDKVYRRTSDRLPFDEEDAVAAQELLPASRLCAEFVALSYRQKFFPPERYNRHKIAIATARLEAGIGGGDLDERAFVAEVVRQSLAASAVEIRNPLSLRTWIHVLDQVSGILLLGQRLFEKGPKLSATYNLGGKTQATVGDVYNELALKAGRPPLASSAGSLSVHTPLNSERAKAELNWEAKMPLALGLEWCWQWYRDFYLGKSTDLHWQQIQQYFNEDGISSEV